MQTSVGLINRSLRRQVRELQLNADRIFIALCNTNMNAEHAMRELWDSGNFNCEPQDYDYIVMRCLEALRRPH